MNVCVYYYSANIKSTKLVTSQLITYAIIIGPIAHR